MMQKLEQRQRKLQSPSAEQASALLRWFDTLRLPAELGLPLMNRWISLEELRSERFRSGKRRLWKGNQLGFRGYHGNIKFVTWNL